MITSRAVRPPVLGPAAFHLAAASDERVDEPRIMRSASIMWHDASASATSNAAELFTPCAQHTFRGSMHPKWTPRLCAIAFEMCAQPAVTRAPCCHLSFVREFVRERAERRDGPRSRAKSSSAFPCVFR